MGTGNHSATSNNMLHLVKRGGGWVGPHPAQAGLSLVGGSMAL